MGGLQRIGMPEGPQNGLGWLAYRRGPISVAKASAPFGRSQLPDAIRGPSETVCHYIFQVTTSNKKFMPPDC